MNLQATLNCAAFAEAHRSSAHCERRRPLLPVRRSRRRACADDKSSFVGLAFRPEGEACVTEIYSSGLRRCVSLLFGRVVLL